MNHNFVTNSNVNPLCIYKKHCLNDVIVLYLIEFQTINIINNLIKNYEIILKHLRITCSDIPSFYQKRTPKLSNLELVAVIT